MMNGGETGIRFALLMLHTHTHTLTAKHKQSRAAIPNPIVVNMKPASFRQWGEFGPHIPIRPVSKAILHNAAQRTAAEQDFDFPQCDSNFIFLWKATWLLRLESRDEQWRAIHNKMLVWSFTYNFSNKYANMLWLVWCGGTGTLTRCVNTPASDTPSDHPTRPLLLDPWRP